MLEISGSNVGLREVWNASLGTEKYTLSVQAKAQMEASYNFIQQEIARGEVIYGVNTGFGSLSSIRISDTDIETLQTNIIRSHSSGIGKPFSKEQSRAIMFLRANALSKGHSGIRPHVVDKILEFLNADVIPVIPSQGSVGASGDLAPLAHLALTLIGEGEVWQNGAIVSAEESLRKHGIKPLQLKAKEGLSLINGCQVMTAVGFLHAYRAKRLLEISDVAGAMSLDALMGSRSAFDPLISASRPHLGEQKTARNLSKILGTSSTLSEAHASCNRVQDPYSLRCMPTVHGAAKDALSTALNVLTIEANSSTDNPLVFAEEGKILSGGNFHGEPVAFQLDFLAIALSAIGSISECRIEKLINPAMNYGLPPFLAKNPGLNSGMMIVEVAAASLVSENKIYSHPASVDSIPTSADKEDHVSMGTIAARKFGKITDNVEHILAMELLCASQALDLRRPLKSSDEIEKIHSSIRKVVPFADTDRVFAHDINAIVSIINSNELTDIIHREIGELEW